MARTGLVLALALTACSGGEGSASDDAGQDGALATVDVLADAVGARQGDAVEFAPVESGTSLVQGDQVRTDAAGFAEVVFFDGSWQRIDHDTILTLTELVDIEGARVVRTGLDTGQAWQRVEALTTEEESVELDTPVAVAAVRGTSYAASCTAAPVSCTFSVVDGTVGLTFSNGTTVPVTAGQRLTATRDQVPGAPEAVGVAQLQQDPWIARNLALDASSPPTAPPGDDESGAAPVDEEFASAAEAICLTAGEQNQAIETGGAAADEVARRQADVLDDALEQLDALEPPPEAAEGYQAMIDHYRRRTALVREALGAPAEQRTALVSELLLATADGAAEARALGLDQCVIRSR